jgi:chemotaxis response regulator CheB
MDHRFSQSPAIRILVVEDFRPFRALIRSLLGENGQFQVLGEASDGLEAVEKA